MIVPRPAPQHDYAPERRDQFEQVLPPVTRLRTWGRVARHSKWSTPELTPLDTGSLPLKLKLALVLLVGLLGWAVMLVSGVVVSTVHMKLAGVVGVARRVGGRDLERVNSFDKAAVIDRAAVAGGGRVAIELAREGAAALGRMEGEAGACLVLKSSAVS